MARPLAPCGTFSAYKRHKRNGEAVDDECRRAAEETATERREVSRGAANAAVRSAIPLVAPTSPARARIDELAEAHATLDWIKAQMDAGVAQGAASLAKQRMEIVALIKRLEETSKPAEVSALDQLAQRRKDRLANAAN